MSWDVEEFFNLLVFVTFFHEPAEDQQYLEDVGSFDITISIEDLYEDSDVSIEMDTDDQKEEKERWKDQNKFDPDTRANEFVQQLLVDLEYIDQAGTLSFWNEETMKRNRRSWIMHQYQQILPDLKLHEIKAEHLRPINEYLMTRYNSIK